MKPQDPHHADSVGQARSDRSMLGPHVVGERVVVRRVLPGRTGPTGGPAMTDVLGVCTAWESDFCVVEPESGPSVRIPLDDIVSGKPVPPRPSVRHRVSPREAQLRALALFPGLHTEPVGDWLLRRSGEHPARRANSVLAFGPSGMDDDIDRVVAFYERPVAAVLPGSAEEAAFRERGWERDAKQPGSAKRAGSGATDACVSDRRLSDDADTAFLIAGAGRALRACRRGDVPEAELVVDGPGLAVARVGDAASGVAAYADDWVGFRAVEVRPEHRGRGLARAVMGELLDWAAAQGATTAYLQVLADNEPALRLYESLGFAEHHTYRYLALKGRGRSPCGPAGPRDAAH